MVSFKKKKELGINWSMIAELNEIVAIIINKLQIWFSGLHAESCLEDDSITPGGTSFKVVMIVTNLKCWGKTSNISLDEALIF